MKRNDLWLNVQLRALCGKDTFAIPLTFGCFLTHPKYWAIPEKIDELDPVFSLQKIEKGWFYKTRGSL